MYERFGVISYLNESRTASITQWFFTLEDAKRYATENDVIVRGVLHNDEGCTPWIENLGELQEAV